MISSEGKCSDTERYTVIEGDLKIKDTFSDTSIEKFNVFLNLKSIKGSLEIADNSNLTNLNFLKNIESVQGNVIIKNNNSLSSIAGLKKLTTIGGKIEFKGNSNLATCMIERYVSQFNSLEERNSKSIIVKNNLYDECSD